MTNFCPWQRPQVIAMFAWFTGEAGLPGVRVSCALPWQSTHVAPTAEPGLFGFACMEPMYAVLCGLVTSGAGDPFGRSLVRESLNVCVAVHASEQPAVERVLQLVLVNVEADCLAVFFGGQRSVAVAGKAVGILDLGRAPAGRFQRPAELRGAKRGGNLLFPAWPAPPMGMPGQTWFQMRRASRTGERKQNAKRTIPAPVA